MSETTAPAIDVAVVAFLTSIVMARPPTRASEPSGPGVRPWAIWDVPEVLVCHRPMSVQVTFTAPSEPGDVEVVGISIYQTPFSAWRVPPAREGGAA